MIPKLRYICYEERLKECGLTTLSMKRLRGDQIKVFKILNGLENIDINILSNISEGSAKVNWISESIRSHRKYSFSQRIINEWNKLSILCKC